jgi:hypothetical protein
MACRSRSCDLEVPISLTRTVALCAATYGIIGVVDASEQPKADWVSRLPKDSMKESMRALADSDDEAERSYYESAADPTADANDRSRRRFRAMYRRRIRHRESRTRSGDL